MRHLILIWLACVAFAWTALSAPPPSFTSLPGHMVEGQCDPFSKAAVRMLHKRGIPAHYIGYGWSGYGIGSGYHAAVLFQFENRFYFIDNQHRGPVPVAGKTDLACVEHVSGGYGKFIHMVNCFNIRIAPKKMADLFKSNPDWMKNIQEGQ